MPSAHSPFRFEDSPPRAPSSSRCQCGGLKNFVFTHEGNWRAFSFYDMGTSQDSETSITWLRWIEDNKSRTYEKALRWFGS